MKKDWKLCSTIRVNEDFAAIQCQFRFSTRENEHHGRLLQKVLGSSLVPSRVCFVENTVWLVSCHCSRFTFTMFPGITSYICKCKVTSKGT